MPVFLEGLIAAPGISQEFNGEESANKIGEKRVKDFRRRGKQLEVGQTTSIEGFDSAPACRYTPRNYSVFE